MYSENILRALGAALLFAFITAGHLPAQIQTTPTPEAPKPILDNDQMVQLQKARAQVLAANPELKVEEVKLKAMHDSAANQSPTSAPAQRNAAFTEWKAYQKKMRAAMLKIDSTLAPIFAKLDSAHKHRASVPASAPVTNTE
jgi:hypothetical protein